MGDRNPTKGACFDDRMGGCWISQTYCALGTKSCEDWRAFASGGAYGQDLAKRARAFTRNKPLGGTQ